MSHGAQHTEPAPALPRPPLEAAPWAQRLQPVQPRPEYDVTIAMHNHDASINHLVTQLHSHTVILSHSYKVTQQLLHSMAGV